MLFRFRQIYRIEVRFPSVETQWTTESVFKEQLGGYKNGVVLTDKKNRQDKKGAF